MPCGWASLHHVIIARALYDQSCGGLLCRTFHKMTIDHLMIKVTSWKRAKAYYSSALEPLGFAVVADWGKLYCTPLDCLLAWPGH